MQPLKTVDVPKRGAREPGKKQESESISRHGYPRYDTRYTGGDKKAVNYPTAEEREGQENQVFWGWNSSVVLVVRGDNTRTVGGSTKKPQKTPQTITERERD